MGDSLFIPDVWDTIKVYDAHIQSIKGFKSEYDALLSNKQEVETANEKLVADQNQLRQDQQSLKEGQNKFAEDQAQLQIDLAKLKEDQKALKAAQQKLTEDRKILEEDRAELNKDKAELQAVITQLRNERAELQRKISRLTGKNTELNKRVDNLAGQLHDVKDHQAQLIDENIKLQALNKAFILQLQVLSVDNKSLKAQVADLEAKVADLNRQLQDQQKPVSTPTTKWGTNQGDDKSWNDVARRFKITTAELFRLNPEINASTPFNFDKVLTVPKQQLQSQQTAVSSLTAPQQQFFSQQVVVSTPTTTWNTRQGGDRSWDEVARRFKITTAELFRLNPDINASTPFKFDKDLVVPLQQQLTTNWNTRQSGDRSWDEVARRFKITTAELFRLNPGINANTPFSFDKDLNVPVLA